MQRNKDSSGARVRERRGRRSGSERGAALVEFALIATPLFLILFGTIEFGWAFFQLNDVRHGAREGIRMVVVNSDYDSADSAVTAMTKLAGEACDRMDERDGVQIRIEFFDADSNGTLEVGDDVELRTIKRLDQLTMVFNEILENTDLSETITSRLEQNPPDGVTTGTTYPEPDVNSDPTDDTELASSNNGWWPCP